MDILTVFLNGDLKEEIYMMQPEGFIQEKEKNLVCKTMQINLWTKASLKTMAVMFPERQRADKLSNEQAPKTEQEKLEMAEKPYASLVGSLMYAQVCTRPDSAFVVSMLRRFQSNPGQAHWVAGKKVMRYLQRTKDYKLDVKTFKSTSGFVFIFGELEKHQTSSDSWPIQLWNDNSAAMTFAKGNKRTRDPLTKVVPNAVFHRHVSSTGLTPDMDA
ncbi:unnamed protein product [Prunus armeniaca]